VEEKKKNRSFPISKSTKRPNRKERRKTLRIKQPVVNEVTQKNWLAFFVKKIIGSHFFWLILSIAIGGFLFLDYPRVWVYPDKTLSPNDPFQGPFILKNGGYLPIHDVHYSLSLEKVDFGQGNTLQHAYSGINEIRIPRLAPNRSSSISLNPFIDLLRQSFGIFLPPKSVTSAEICIDLSYRSYLIPYNFADRIRFRAATNSRGEYAWSEFHGQ